MERPVRRQANQSGKRGRGLKQAEAGELERREILKDKLAANKDAIFVTSHQGNVCQNHSEIPLHICWGSLDGKYG